MMLLLFTSHNINKDDSNNNSNKFQVLPQFTLQLTCGVVHSMGLYIDTYSTSQYQSTFTAHPW